MKHLISNSVSEKLDLIGRDVDEIEPPTPSDDKPPHQVHPSLARSLWHSVRSVVAVLWLFVGAAILIGLGVAIVGAVIAGAVSLWREGQQRVAEICLVTAPAVLMQILFLARVSPAFRPPQGNVRIAQRYLPIKQSEITRQWFRQSRTNTIGVCSVIAVIHFIALISHASPVVAFTNLLWQLLVLLGLTHLAYVAISRCGHMSWISTIAFWTYACLSLLSFHGAVLVAELEFVAFMAGPFLALLYVPTWMTLVLSPHICLGIMLLCWIVILARAYQNGRLSAQMFSPSHKRLLRISRSWRNLPDRDDPKPSSLTYPIPEREPSTPPESHRIASRLIRESIGPPSPKSLSDPVQWRRVRIICLGLLFLHASMMTGLAILQIKAKMQMPLLFGMAAILSHAPAIRGVILAIPLLRSRLMTASGLLRINLRGIAADTIIAAAVLLPFALVIGQVSGDNTAPMLHVAWCLLTAAVLRFITIIAIRFHAEYISLCVAFYAAFLMVMAGFGLTLLLQAAFGIGLPSAMYFLPLQVAFGIIVFGSDRLAARLQPHVPPIKNVWKQVMCTPLGIPFLRARTPVKEQTSQ